MGFIGFFKKNKKNNEVVQEMVVEQPKKIQAGLALGGGGARGFGHVGVLRAFEENGIEFKYISGTSVGSMIGAMYANGLTPDEMEAYSRTLREKDIRNSKIFFIPSNSSNLEDVVINCMGDLMFSDLKKPFCAVAVDVKSGEELHIKNGLVARAVSASCSVPGVFTPVVWQNCLLHDGGITNNIPSDVVRSMGADVVVAVDINSTRGGGTDSTKVLDILAATLGMAMKASSQKGIDNADFVIRPNLQRFKSTKFEGFEEMIEEGYKAGLEAVPEVKRLLGLIEEEKIVTEEVKEVTLTKKELRQKAKEEKGRIKKAKNENQ